MKTPLDFTDKPPVQGPVGKNPASYLKELPGDQQEYEASTSSIPANGRRKLTRAEVRALCRDKKIHPLVAYACVMAWGGRNFSNYRLTLSRPSISNLEALLGYLWAGNGSREKDFAHTQQAAKEIKGLGISFYTKLLFFFRPKADAYILDQWTAKSAVRLFPECNVALNSSGLPRADTNPKVYGSFCAKLDSLAGAGQDRWGANWTGGEDVELTLFDKPGGDWRNYLKSIFPSKAKDSNPLQRSRPPRTFEFNPTDKIEKFAGALAVKFHENERLGMDLPEASGGFNPPNRLYLRQVGFVIWQFTLAEQKTTAQIWFPKDHTERYNHLIDIMRVPTVDEDHRFTDFIIGTGVKRRPSGDPYLTRAINLTVAGGYDSPEANWSAICQDAVAAMNELFEYVGPALT